MSWISETSRRPANYLQDLTRGSVAGLQSAGRPFSGMQAAESTTAVEDASSAERAAAERSAVVNSRRALLVAAGVLAVWALFAASRVYPGQLFLAEPPITRRHDGFYQFQGDGCSFQLAQGTWTRAYCTVGCVNSTQQQYATCADTPQRQWQFGPAAQACGARRFAAADARQLLAGQRLVFAGDSITRLLYGALLRMLGEPGQDIVVGHQDFQHQLAAGIALQFFWAPYPANLTALLGRLQQEEEQQQQGEQEEQPHRKRFRRLQQQQQEGGEEGSQHNRAEEQQQQQGADVAADAALPTDAAAQTPVPPPSHQQHQAPALMVLSTTLWHLLHFTAAEDYALQLLQLKEAAAAYSQAAAAAAAVKAAAAGATSPEGGAQAPADSATAGSSGGAGQPRLVLASGTETYPNTMKTEVKRQHMTPSNLDAYNRAMEQAQLLEPGGPFWLLDLFSLTQQCGEECSIDGVHSQPQVYEAALQLLLNIAAVQQQQQQQQLEQQQGQAEQPQRTRRALQEQQQREQRQRRRRA